MNLRLLLKLGGVILVLCLASSCGCTVPSRVDLFSGSRLAFQMDGVALVRVDWSLSGNLILQGWSTSERFPLYVTDIQTGVMTPLIINQKLVSGSHPALSPAGGSVAFFDHDLEQIQILQLSQPPETELLLPHIGHVTWSPDGQQLAVMSKTSNTVTIHLCDLQGQEIAQVFEISSHRLKQLGDIAWSPDGRRIAFSLVWETEGDKSQGDIYILSENNKVIQLTDTPSAKDSHPSWSPDGGRLVFSSVPVGRPAEVAGQLFFSNADGSCIKPVPVLEGIDSPSWSPGGDEIAVASEGKIYILDIASLGAEFSAIQLTCP